ncbi:3'-5' exonuclease [Aquibacillus salsiterrae]|uniref:Exonuclease domain-containing protein n=1 Tax=Aquibacillus salsiterrae TaxID=2950439 RepID=A0A9X4AE38_9BACI|nr:3'-5' exonuclease [Aquibacillus salsiterrae]MDC3416246.1 exonuclease domain-containing protein [Aquibacillus salsiterrae]
MAELKYFIFFDFEMLCSNRGMAFEEMEAIRLGAVKYHIDSGKIDYFDKYIKPTQQKPLSKFCKKLTSISDEDIRNAPNFNEVFSSFLTWVGGVKKSRFFSWSNSDLLRLKCDSHLHRISASLITKIESRYVDFQAVFTKRVSKDNLSVNNALKLYGLSFIGHQHNPMYDAYNTLRIFLSFHHDPLQSDLIMLDRFIFGEMFERIDEVNPLVIAKMNKDVHTFLVNLEDIYKMKHVDKLLKQTKRLVSKYENILINRSGLFSKEVTEKVQLLKEFYADLCHSYKEHVKHSSKVMMLDEHIVTPMKQIAS